MTKQYQLAIHLFRRDLRLQDNTALIEALTDSEKVLPVFIFDPRQIKSNDYKSDHAISFMVQSLVELDEELKNKGSKLYFFYGKSEEIIKKLLTTQKVDALYFNRDYTPFSLDRDKKIIEHCKDNNVEAYCCSDALLFEPEEIAKKDGTPYTVYSYFMKLAKTLKVREPHRNNRDNYFSGNIKETGRDTLKQLAKNSFPNLLVKGGREEAKKLLLDTKKIKNYDDERNIPSVKGTSYLSAHNKFGTLSIREYYYYICKTFNKNHTLINELIWRDFFTHIAFHFPAVFGQAFQKKYNKLTWKKNDKHFKAWCEGKTGFPIVDAGMRELNATGYMHNRVRMIVASFLVKDLHIDWRLGEQYFAQKLTDYDPAVNNGNWQWAASTGCDAQPYFRIFNPWLQQKKFDPKCDYIKKWVPELEKLDTKIINKLNEIDSTVSDYPSPIVNHKEESKKAISMYKKI